MRFAVFTHVLHNRYRSGYSAYAPYVKEMNLWFRQVSKVTVVAPVSVEAQKRVQENYRGLQLHFSEIPSFSVLSFNEILKTIVKLPVLIFRIAKAMHQADHIHIRCPGNVGLLACLLQIFFPKKMKSAKYAGNWDPKAKQPRTYTIQKWLLSNTFLTRNMQVLVYGDWPNQTKNIKTFFTASFSKKEISAVREKSFDEDLTFLFIGNLVSGKNPLKAIEIVREIGSGMKRNQTTRQISLEIYGDGPEREILEDYCRNKDLGELVKFKGSRTLEELKKVYQKSHFVILPSRSEGWPKAIAEAMFFGCIPIATPVSCVPWMLGVPPALEGGAKLIVGNRGILLADLANSQRLKANGSKEWTVVSGQWAEDVKEILNIMKNPLEMQRMSEEAKKWSQQYTLERFESAIKEVLNV